MLVRWLLFAYFGVQLSGISHLVGHWAAANAFGSAAQIRFPWWRLVPVAGGMWTLTEGHEPMRVVYDETFASRSPEILIAVAFAGMYAQVLHIMVGACVFLGGKRVALRAWGILAAFVLLVYMPGYAWWLFEDPSSDFVMLNGWCSLEGIHGGGIRGGDRNGFSNGVSGMVSSDSL